MRFCLIFLFGRCNTKLIDEEVQVEIPSVEEEIVIEPKPKTKVIIKKKVKKPLLIVEDEDVVV